MRGQFFVISAVIIITSLVLITQYLYDFGRTNLASLAELRETDYVRYIRTTLNNSADTNCTLAGDELNASEKFLTGSLAERGMILSTYHNIVGTTVNIRFNITTPGFGSQTAFTTLCR